MSVEIDVINYRLIEIDGTPYHSDNEIYLQRIADGDIFIIPLTNEIENMFFPQTSAASASDCDHQSDQVIPAKSFTKTWSRRNILALIELVKVHQKDFQSSTIKNDTIWNRISSELQAEGSNFTPTQCRDKYKYLKGKYTKKKDNMSSRASGAEAVKFDYFNEMDAFLGERHNVAPIALASNLKTHDATEDTDALEINSDEEPRPSAKRVKKTKHSSCKRSGEHPLTKLVNALNEKVDQKEQNVERRHQENLEARQKSIEAYVKKIDDLISVLAKKT